MVSKRRWCGAHLALAVVAVVQQHVRVERRKVRAVETAVADLRRGAERVLVQALAAEYVADRSTTEFVLRLGSAASIEAADIAGARSIPERDAHIDRTVRFILAGVEALAAKRPADQREAALTS